MDKNKIKSFAIWARRNLIAAVSEKANRIGIYDDKIEEAIAVQGGFKLEEKEEIFPLSKNDRDVLVRQVKEKGFDEVMEEVAYTWFNRFMGLRYMEVNDYLPTGVRILSSEVEGKKEPDVLTRVSEVIDELSLNAEYIYNLLDSGDTLDREKAYRIILVKQCNELGKIIPQMFEKISDYTELLLPDNLLEESSVIRKMVQDIQESDWLEEVEIIGWMYQYYISEKKDEVFAALKKNVKITKENIPAATQLFTPKWIVKYMVENSLGRLWLEGHSQGDVVDSGKCIVDSRNSRQCAVDSGELKKKWKYYLDEAEQEPEVEEELQKIREEHAKLTPEDIKVLDPCMGSGHILVYAFDVLYEIYKTAGYSEREIPRLILQNNLYGLDIDDRAAQLASFALIMKARHYNRRLFREIEREHLELNLCSIQESNSIHKEAIDYFCSLETGLDNDELENDLEYLRSTFTDAKEYGSILEVEEVNFEALKQRLKEIEQEENFMFGDYRKMLLDKLPMMIKQAEIMNRLYEVCVTNPPYMGRKGMQTKLKEYINKNYEISKSDLFSVFIDKYTDNKIVKNYSAFISMQSWLFLGTYEKLRENLINNNNFVNLLQIGYNSFPGMNSQIAHAATFTFYNKYIKDYNSVYCDLNSNELITADKDKVFIKKMQNNDLYEKKQEDYLYIPGKNIAYWISENFKEIFRLKNNVSNFTSASSQNITGNNEKFLRFHWELNRNTIGKMKKWRLYAKGGGYRKWYGNLLETIDWSPQSREIYRSGHASQIIPKEYWYKKGITWGLISTSTPSFRILPDTATFDKGGSSIFVNKDTQYNELLGFLNSKVALKLLNIFNTTINYQVRDIRNLPICDDIIVNVKIQSLVENCVNISRKDWNSFEVSIDFKVHPLLLVESGKWKVDSNDEQKNTANYISDAFDAWKSFTDKQFNQLKANEEELNRIFIDIYELQDELTPEVEDKDVTIRKADRERDIKSLISYAVGCMFGRYSIDSEGLIYAGSVVNSGKCIVNGSEVFDSEKKMTSFDAVLSNIVNEVRKNESAKLSRTDSVAEGNGFSGEGIHCDREVSEGRDVCTDKPDTQSCSFNTFKYSRRTITQVDGRISKFLVHCTRFKSGSGDANADCPAFKLCQSSRSGADNETNKRNWKNGICTDEKLKITTHCPLSTIHYLPDDDNIIPITEDEYFEDDIVSRFIEFVRTVYGEKTLEENLDFIADSIGRKTSETARQAIRRYFIKDFYKDHLKVYQKRPIYWMFESGKNNGFKALVYMHRYNDQTVAKVRTDYLHTLQRKYEAEIQRQQLIVDSEEYTAKDRTAAKKKIAKISKQIEECREYDQVVAHLANEKISIDLDDGVKVNYAKFQDIKVINSKGKEIKMNLLAKI